MIKKGWGGEQMVTLKKNVIVCNNGMYNVAFNYNIKTVRK